MNKFFVVIICIALCSCKPKQVSPEELQAFILDESNGLYKSAEFNGTKVSVMFRPTDLWVSQEIENVNVSNTQLNSVREKYSSYYYFVVSLSRNNKEALHQVSGMGEYSDLVQTMSFRMPRYVTLTTSRQDTIPVGDFMLNRTYGLNASTDLLFVFNKKKDGNNWVQFNLNEFGLGLGNQRFRFSTEDLEQVPPVSFGIIN